MYLRQYTEGYHTLKTRWCRNTMGFFLSCPLGKSLQKYLTLNTNWCKNTLDPFCITLIALWVLTFFWALQASTIKVTNNLKTNIQYKTKPPTKIGLFQTAKKTHIFFPFTFTFSLLSKICTLYRNVCTMQSWGLWRQQF